MPKKLSLTDKKILLEMNYNCRRPLSKIAKKLHMSQQALQYRIKLLEEKGVIPMYYTLVNTAMLDYRFYRVMIRFQSATSAIEKKIREDLMQHPKTFWVATSLGRWDLLVDFYDTSAVEFDKAIQEFLEKHFKYISQKTIATIVKSYQYTRSFILNETKEEFKGSYGGASELLILNDIDKKILLEIKQNPTIKIVQLAQKVDIDRKTIKNRLQKMQEQGLILGYRARLELTAAGYHSYKLIIRLSQARKSVQDQLLLFARANKNIIYLNKILGDWDAEFDIETQTQEEFYELLAKIKNEFSNSIRDYEIIKLKKTYKLNYVPPL